MEDLIFINENKSQIIYKHFKYQRSAINKNGTSYYVCIDSECGVSLTTDEDAIAREPKKKHRHDPVSDCEIDIKIAINKLKISVQQDLNLDTQTAYNNIYLELVVKYKAEKKLLTYLWKEWSEIKHVFKYHRSLKQPKLPKDHSEISITGELAYLNGKPFLRFDNKDSKSRILIFMSDSGAETLANSMTWHFDGTFKACPKLFYQILTIHGNFHHRVIPCAYILLSKKNRQIYLETFSKLKEILLGDLKKSA